MATPETVHKLFADAWNRRDFKAIRDLLHAEYTYTGGDGKEITGGPDVGVNIAESYANAFPDGRLEVRRTFVQGNTAISELRAVGTQRGELMGIAPTGKPIDIVICNILELRDGKVVREREYFDAATLLTQLGVMSQAAHT